MFDRLAERGSGLVILLRSVAFRNSSVFATCASSIAWTFSWVARISAVVVTIASSSSTFFLVNFSIFASVFSILCS